VGAEGTRRLEAFLGRANYVEEDALRDGLLDSGAMGVVGVLKGLGQGRVIEKVIGS